MGTLILPNGGRYVGEWLDGKEHGNGTLYNAQGEAVYRGRWIDGEPID